MTAGADANYSINPWMNPTARVGDNVDPSMALDAMGVIAEIEANNPLPPAAGQPMRLLGMERTQPGIVDVLGVGPVSGLMQDTESRQDSGQPGTVRPASSPW